MKPIFLLVLVFAASVSSAQTADEKAVSEQVEKLRLAMLKPDRATLESLTTEALSYGHSSGMIEDREAFITALVDKKSVFTSISFEDQGIKISDNAAIVRHRLTGDILNNNTPGKVDILILLVWQKQSGVWKLLARQATRTPAPQPKN